MDDRNEGSIELQDPNKEMKPKVTINQAPDLVWNMYGLKATDLKELPSYDDLNYYFKADPEFENSHISEVKSNGYVLKILNSLQSSNPVIIEAHHAMMNYVRERGVATQAVVLNKCGKDFSVEAFTDENQGTLGPYIVRVVTFVPGTIFHQTPYVAGSFHNAGIFLGRLHQALKGFHHSFYDNYTLIWSLVETPVLKDFLHAVKDDKDRATVGEIIEAFKASVLPELKHFQKGIIHGDVNEQNLIMQKTDGEVDTGVHDVAAILDFADSTYSYTVMDVAITIAYLSIDCPVETQLDVGGHILSGYYKHNTLNDAERKCIKTLVCSRLCQSLVYGAHSYAQQPWNDYLLTTAKGGWPLMHRLWRTDEQKLYARWDAIIKSWQNKC